MKKYNVENYLIHEIEENKAVIQTKYNTTLINNRKLIDFLFEIERNNKHVVLENDVYKYFDNESEEVLEFLIDNCIIKTISVKTLTFTKIIIVSDDKEVKELLYNSIQENRIIKTMTLDDYLNNSDVEDALVICFINKFHSTILKSVINKTESSKNSYLLLSYSYNQSVIFNCLYSRKIGLPCPKCTKGILDGQVYEEDGGITYQQLLKMIYEIDEDYRVEYPLTFKVKVIITLTIIKQMELLILDDSINLYNLHNQDYTNIFKLDLATEKVIRDTAIYWELCDCYGGD